MNLLLRYYYITFGGIRKNSKVMAYLRGFARMAVPRWWCRWRAGRDLAAFGHADEALRRHILERVDYYCNIPAPDVHPLSAEYPTLADNRLRHTDHEWPSPISRVKRRLAGPEMYFFDSYRYTRCFPQRLRWNIEGGDVNREFPEPSITKARPVADGPSRNVIFPLNRVRHFIFFDDPIPWEQKLPVVIFRGAVQGKPRRRQFLDMWQQHPMCDLRDSNDMTIFDHLRFRYIMALEGNDVASNLKWVMSSGSIAVMPRPTSETWFMEGRLIPDYHYICIADDYHDLMDRIAYYEQHPDAAKAIVRHAHEWVCQFRNVREERLTALLVMQKYLKAVNP